MSLYRYDGSKPIDIIPIRTKFEHFLGTGFDKVLCEYLAEYLDKVENGKEINSSILGREILEKLRKDRKLPQDDSDKIGQFFGTVLWNCLVKRNQDSWYLHPKNDFNSPIYDPEEKGKTYKKENSYQIKR